MKKAVCAAVVLGFVGAALFYLPYVGGVEVPFFCPLCPHIDSIGDPLQKFVRYTLVSGVMNAMIFALVAFVTVLAFRRGSANRSS